MVLKKVVREISLITRQSCIADCHLSQLNMIVRHIEQEVQQSLLHESEEKDIEIDKLDDGFVAGLVDIRLDRYSSKPPFGSHPETPWQDELNTRVGDKLNEIREYYKHNKREKI